MQTFLHYRWRVPSTLHRLHLRRIIPLLLLAQCVTGAKAQTYQSYDANTCYTKVLIDAKINDFAGNTKPMGFGTYNSETDVITQPQWKTDISNGSNRDLAIDYVAGLVAKACIEAAVYYQDFTWSKPWFKLVENYATNVKVTVPTTGASLDDLNAAKMYFALADLTNKGAKYENSTTYDRAINQLKNAIDGLKAVNEKYSIRSGSTVNYYSSGNQTCKLVDAGKNELSPATSGMNAIGGWYHKATYPNQMWCDSEYMGPALLAQLVAYATENEKAGIGTVTSSKEDDWKLIAKQFDITWNYLWNSTDKLLYHGFSATPTAIAAHTHTWATGTNGKNTAYWGRAIGWYFLALVDVLENMPDNITDDSYTKTQDNLSSRNANIKTRLTSYLTDLAAGIWKWRKTDSNLWTNVINEAVGAEHNTYQTTSDALRSNTQNYLEASASAIYIAAYIKAMRLKLLPETYKSGIETAYQNYISNFITTDNKIINTCASAGLGGGSVKISTEQEDYKSGGKKYRDGTADYYTRGYDVTKVTNYQEGKPLGAFILASTEYERYMKDDYGPSFTAANDEKPTAQTVTRGQSVTLHAAAMAKPLAEYQWYSYPASSTRSTDTQGTPISDETSADLTVTPQANTYYYCVATNSVGSVQTDPVLVTVSEADGKESVIATFKNATVTTWNATENNGFSISGVVMKSGTPYVKMEANTTLTMKIPSGYTVTGLKINALCTSGNTNSVLSFNNGETNVGTVTINYGSKLGDYNCTFSNNVIGQATITIKNGTKEVNINTIEVLGYSGTSTTYTITYDLNGLDGTIPDVTGATALPSELPTPATVEGYTFGGWYTDAGCTTAATPGAKISANTTLYAKWTKNTYAVTATATADNGTVTITFTGDDSGNTITSGSQVEHGKSLTFTATANSGYEFSGWTVNDNPVAGNSNVYTIESLTGATDVTANFTKTSSGGGESGGSGTGTVIYFPSGKTSSNEDVLTVSSGNARSGLNVSYGGQTYTNGVKMESSTKIYLNLDVESAVTFVFDKPNKQFKVSGTIYTTGQDGTFTITLGAETHTISKVDTDVNLVAVEVKSSGSSISFTTHPEDAEYVTSTTATATALKVEAQLNNFTGTETPTIKYQWYKNPTTKSTEGGVEIEGQTNKSYIPDISTAGTTYYYCKASATVGGKDLWAYSNIATVTVSNPTLTIVTQPVGATYAKGQDGVEPLIVVATTNTGNKIEYQWYSNSSNNTAGATAIQNEKSDSYTPPVTEVGEKYYYCEVKSGSLTKTTNPVAITVDENAQPIYGYKVSKAGLEAPKINSSMYINTKTDGTGENLVKMTFGGWKWNGGTYKKPGSDTEITDTWKASETVSGVEVLDGYQYWFSGTQDAKQENKDAETEMYGQIRNGWFVSPTRENGITTDSHPYTLPVRGSFMTFEPTKNGTLTIYILQNGAWNTFDKDTKLDGVSYKKGDIKPGEFRMHAFQITNQRGLVLAEFAPKYSVTNNQMVETGYSCTKWLDSEKPSTFDKTSKDVSNWEEFWELSETERQAVKVNWSDAENNTPQKIIKLENGSFLAIQKAVVKYQFHVTGNETYYFFSNFSKMGFSGATFQPDADSGQPTDDTTFSGTNSLDEIKPYIKITWTEDGQIGDTGLTKYKYTKGDQEIKLVEGVFIPQFKKITLNRTFKKKQWTTLTLPFNLTQTEVEQIFGKGTQILVFEDAITNGTKLHIKFFYHEIQNILPGYPYLIKPTLVMDDQETPMVTQDTSKDNAPIYTIDESGNLTSFTVYGKAINPHIEQHNFTATTDTRYVAKGTPDYCTANVNGDFSKLYEEGDLFISDTNGTLYISKGASYGKGYRSYIDGPGSSATKTLSLSFSGVEDGEDDGTTTEISVAELADDVIEAFGIKGVYNLNGQKVAETTRNLPAGIYVVNGRKVVVK